MSRLRVLGAGVLIASVVLGASACSKDEKKATSSDRGVIAFADPPAGSTDLGLCYAYDLKQMKALIGGDEDFKQLAPAAIGTKDDKVHGEACAWQRTDPNGDSLSLRIEARDFGTDTAALAAQFETLRTAAIDNQPVESLGDAAFATVADDSTVLQVRTGPYLLTLSSRASGSLKPIGLDAMSLLATAGVDKLS
ncbi:hypothetical protein [Aquihabitans sp. McL0605]|uniref:hypothetical protein n=1 Tax=Aquihabitans sp. McL0605 TaxID=3415671 RepID=UPI003CE8B10A